MGMWSLERWWLCLSKGLGSSRAAEWHGRHGGPGVCQGSSKCSCRSCVYTTKPDPDPLIEGHCSGPALPSHGQFTVGSEFLGNAVSGRDYSRAAFSKVMRTEWAEPGLSQEPLIQSWPAAQPL